MSEHERYSPTDNVIQFIRRLIAFCHKNPDQLLEAGAFFDRRYSTRGIRKYEAIKIREHRSIPDHTKRSRASARKEFDYDGAKLRLGFAPTPLDAVSPPPRRQKGPDGKPLIPDIPLRERFDRAFCDTFDDEDALRVLEAEKREQVAARRVLMAWLRLDPDRSTVKRITVFQDLRSVLTDDGLPDDELLPVWASGDADPASFDEALFVARDGSLERGAPRWIAKAREALNALDEAAKVRGSHVESIGLKLDEDSNEGVAQKVTSRRMRCVEETKVRGIEPKDVAKERGENYVKKSPFPGLNKLAAWCECHHSVMQKAIEISPVLQRAQAQHKLRTAKAAPTRKPHDDSSWPGVVDEVLRQLIEYATPEDRASLQTPEMRDELSRMEPNDLASFVANAPKQAEGHQKARVRA